MKLSTLIRWMGPAAIGGGVAMVFSDLLGLTVYVPGLGEAAQTGYQAVGSGVILFALVLLLVGMVGLYAGKAEPGGARVLESGTGYPADHPRSYGSGLSPERSREFRRLSVGSGVSRGGGHRASYPPLASSDARDREA